NDADGNGLVPNLLGDVSATIQASPTVTAHILDSGDDSGNLLKRDLLNNILGEVIASAVAPINIVANINPDEDGNGLVPNLIGAVSATIQASPTVTAHIFDADDYSGGLLKRDLLKNILGEVIASAVAPVDVVANINPDDDGNGLVPNLLGAISATVQATPTVTVHIFDPDQEAVSSAPLKRDLVPNLLGEVIASAVAPLNVVANIQHDANGNGLVPNLVGDVSATIQASPTVTVHIFDADDYSGDLLKRDLVPNLLGEVIASAVAPINIVANIQNDADGNGLVPNLLGDVSATIQASPTVTAHILDSGDDSGNLLKRDNAPKQGVFTEHINESQVAVFIPMSAFGVNAARSTPTAAEAAAAYFEYVGNAALSMRESVLRHHTVDVDGAHQTFKDLQQVITRLEDIYDTLGRSAIALPPTASLTGGNAGDPDSSSDHNPRRKSGSAEPTGRLPPIPLSDLSKLVIMRTYAATMAIQQRKAQIGRADTAHARRLMEEEQIGREDLDKLSQHLRAVEALSLTAWDVCAIAREIARIDTQLFAHVQMPEDMVVRSRAMQSGGAEVDVASSVRNCAGFAVFLGHAAAGILLDTAASVAKGAASNLAPPSARSPAPAPRRSMESEHRDRHAVSSLSNLKGHPHIVTCLIVLAHILVRVFGDFNGGIAVLWALTLPEIRRLQSLWRHVDQQTVGLLEDLCGMTGMQSASVGCIALGPSGSAGEETGRIHTIDEARYHSTLKAVAAELKDRYTGNPLDIHSQTAKSLIVAIPYMPRSISSLRRLYSMYTMSADGSQVLLSAPGAQLLDQEKRVFGWCRIHSSAKAGSHSPHDLRHRSRQHTYMPGIYTVEAGDNVYQIYMPVTLSELIDTGCSMEPARPHTPSMSTARATQLSVRDASLQHWILTRPFFSTGLIRSASVRIQTPLASEAGIFLERSESSESEAVLQSSSAAPNVVHTMVAPPSVLSEPTTFTRHLAARDHDQRDVESDIGSMQVPLDAYRINHETSEVSSQVDDVYADNVDAEQLPSVDDFLGQFLATEQTKMDEHGVPDYLQSSALDPLQSSSLEDGSEDRDKAGDALDSVSDKSSERSDDSVSVRSSSSEDSSGSGGLSDLDLPSVPVTGKPAGEDAYEEVISGNTPDVGDKDAKAATDGNSNPQAADGVSKEADSSLGEEPADTFVNQDEKLDGTAADQGKEPAEAAAAQDAKGQHVRLDEQTKKGLPSKDEAANPDPAAASDAYIDADDNESTVSKHEDAGEPAPMSPATSAEPRLETGSKRPDEP
ncbi:hypothetical protein EC988_002397, partial [Linderina pennispora]